MTHSNLALDQLVEKLAAAEPPVPLLRLGAQATNSAAQRFSWKGHIAHVLGWLFASLPLPVF